MKLIETMAKYRDKRGREKREERIKEYFIVILWGIKLCTMSVIFIARSYLDNRSLSFLIDFREYHSRLAKFI